MSVVPAFASDADTGGWVLCRTDRTPSGTFALTSAFPGTPAPADLTVAGDLLYFVDGSLPDRRGLWRTDGTAAGTILLQSLPADQPVYIGFLAAVGDALVFSVSLEGVEELWTSDGTILGTKRLKQINDRIGGYPVRVFSSGIPLGFLVDEHDGRFAIWRTDGTESGTVRLALDADLIFGDGPALVGSRLFFGADDRIHGTELWAADLTS